MIRLIIVGSYFALTRVRADAITAPSLRASASAFQEPAMGTLPLPTYIFRPAAHARGNEFFISGIFIEGIAGMTSVTVTCASLIGFPFASVNIAWNVLS